MHSFEHRSGYKTGRSCKTFLYTCMPVTLDVASFSRFWLAPRGNREGSMVGPSTAEVTKLLRAWGQGQRLRNSSCACAGMNSMMAISGKVGFRAFAAGALFLFLFAHAASGKNSSGQIRAVTISPDFSPWISETTRTRSSTEWELSRLAVDGTSFAFGNIR